MPSPAIIIGALVCCCFVILAIVLGVYFSGVSCPDFGSECTSSPSPAAGTPGTLTPLQIILQGSQTLQGAEYNITAMKPVTFTAPAEPVNYTMAFWLKVDNHSPNWREIWRRQGVSTPDQPPVNGWNRVPAFYLSGNDDPNGAGHVHYIHGSTDNWNTHTYSNNFKATPGTWFHFVATVDSTTKRITAYVNGVLEPSKAGIPENTTGTFKWVTQDLFNLNDHRGVHIAKWYFIPRVLSATDIATLAADSPAASGSSTYMPEPFAGNAFTGY